MSAYGTRSGGDPPGFPMPEHHIHGAHKFCNTQQEIDEALDELEKDIIISLTKGDMFSPRGRRWLKFLESQKTLYEKRAEEIANNV